MTNDTANFKGFSSRSIVNEDVRADVAVVDYSRFAVFFNILVCIAHDATNIFIVGDAAIGQDYSVDDCTIGTIEYTMTIRHTKSTDCKSLTIVVAFEEVTYAFEITLTAAGIIPVAGVFEGDVSRLLERLAVGITAAFDVIGKVNEVLRVFDFVVAARRIVRQAVDSILCPRCHSGEQHEQHSGYSRHG